MVKIDSRVLADVFGCIQLMALRPYWAFLGEKTGFELAFNFLVFVLFNLCNLLEDVLEDIRAEDL